MAASMMRFRPKAVSRIRPVYNAVRHASSSYYVLLPEIPPDTPVSNSIMRVHEYPDFSDINPDRTITGCAKLSLDYEVGFGKHVENLRDPTMKKTFSTVFDPIERLSVPMNFGWRTAKILNYVSSDGDYRTAFSRIHPQVERAKNEKWISADLHRAVKEVAADADNLSSHQRRMVTMYLTEARFNGIEFDGPDKKKFMDVLSNLVNAKKSFRNRVMLSHNMFSQTLDDLGNLQEMPKSILTQMAQDKTNPSRGPWKVTLNQNIYSPFLEYCSNSTMRWNVWQAFNNRASIQQDTQNLSNHNVIKDIRQYRKDLANMLGYENYAGMSLETKMAGSVENVMSMIENFKTKFLPLAQEEITQLQEFATSEGYNGTVQAWDIPYWRRRHRQHLFSLDQGAVSEYYPLPRVLEGLYEICDELFGIQIKDCTGEVNTWDQDVKFMKIFNKEDGAYIGAFYLDPFSRRDKLGGAWMEPGRDRSEVLGTTPLSYLIFNLPRPVGGDQPALLSVDALATLFYEFGHGLQQLLTRVPYSDIGGQRNIEWDALQISANVMSMLLYHPTTLRRLSSHWQTGETISDDMIAEVLNAQKYMSGYETMRQLYYAALDMEMYISDDHWHRVMMRVWDQFMPISQPENDNHPCSLTAIFSDQYPAAYYSFKWAEMIAADVFRSFEEAGLDDVEATAATGRRFRNTFLEEGGGLSANQVFRRFRGRDPSPEAFLKMRGVK